MYFNPSYMNPIAQQPMQQEFSQQPTQEPLEGIASLAPTQPTQPTRPEQNPDAIRVPDLRGGGGSVFPFPGMNSTEVGTVDPIMQGFQNSEFYKNANKMQQDAVNFKYKGKDMMMNGSMSGAFKQYLDSTGKGNLYEGELFLQQPLQPKLIGDKILPFDMAPITPYMRNENLDLTDRSGIMGEYNKYIQGGMGSRAHTADMRGGYSFMGEEMGPGSSTGFGDFRKFLDTFGIGDRLQRDTSSFGAQPLQQTGEGLQGLAAYQSQQNTGPGI